MKRLLYSVSLACIFANAKGQYILKGEMKLLVVTDMTIEKSKLMSVASTPVPIAVGIVLFTGQLQIHADYELTKGKLQSLVVYGIGNNFEMYAFASKSMEFSRNYYTSVGFDYAVALDNGRFVGIPCIEVGTGFNGKFACTVGSALYMRRILFKKNLQNEK